MTSYLLMNINDLGAMGVALKSVWRRMGEYGVVLVFIDIEIFIEPC